MPWQEMLAMSLRQEFVMLARREGANMRELCRRFSISPQTGYKWQRRFEEEGPEGLQERSRRPHHSPARVPAWAEAAIVEVRGAHPSWGGRKIQRRLRELGHIQVPSVSTVTEVLRRHGCIGPDEAAKHRPWQRFEHVAPNDLWQMDFKGHFPLSEGRCHPLTVLDDHSRFSLGLAACANERGETVQQQLTGIFRRYGMPRRMLMDNGPPWGHASEHIYTPLTVWLLRLGMQVSHGRPYHPQTQGKCERFHRTLRAELLQGRVFIDLPAAQRAFDRWRDVYNTERPHEALGLDTPADHYTVSPRGFPEALPAVEYGEGELVRKVHENGEINFKGHEFRIPKAFLGYPVALRPTPVDGVWSIWFMAHEIAQVDLTGPNPIVESVNHVSEHV